MKKTLALLLVALMVFAVMAGCTPTTPTPEGTTAPEGTKAPEKTDPPAETEKPVEKVVITTNFSEAEMGEAAIEGFETNYPNIDIEVKDLAGVAVLAAIAAGNAPDCIRVLGARDVPPYVGRKLCVPLDDYIATLSTYAKPLLDAGDCNAFGNVYCWDGKVQGQGARYGFVKDFSQDYMLWVNTELFDAVGVKYPSDTDPMTWQEMFKLAADITQLNDDGTVKIYGYGNLDAGNSGLNYILVQQCLQQIGKSLWNDDYTKCDFTTQPEVKQVFQMWIDACNSTKGILSPNSPNADGIYVLFRGQKAAMGGLGYWFSGSLRSIGVDEGWTEEQLNAKAKLYPCPYMEGGEVLSPTSSCCGGLLYARSEHPEETFIFMDYFFAGPPAVARAKGGWGLPQWTSFFDYLPQETLFDKQSYEVSIAELNDRNGFVKFNPYLEHDGVNTVFDEELLKVFQQGASLDDALKNIETRLQVLIDEGYKLINP